MVSHKIEKFKLHLVGLCIYLVRSRTTRTHVLARERNIFVGYAFLNIEAVKESLVSPESLYRQMHVCSVT